MKKIILFLALSAIFLAGTALVLSQDSTNPGIGMSVSVQCLRNGVPVACGSATQTTTTTTTTTKPPANKPNKISSNFTVGFAVSANIISATTTTSAAPPASNPQPSGGSGGGGGGSIAIIQSTTTTTTTTSVTSTTTTSETAATSGIQPGPLTGFFSLSGTSLIAAVIGIIALTITAVILFIRFAGQQARHQVRHR